MQIQSMIYNHEWPQAYFIKWQTYVSIRRRLCIHTKFSFSNSCSKSHLESSHIGIAGGSNIIVGFYDYALWQAHWLTTAGRIDIKATGLNKYFATVTVCHDSTTVGMESSITVTHYHDTKVFSYLIESLMWHMSQ